LGYAGLVQFVPAVALTLVTGQAADRFDRRRLLLFCNAGLVLCSLLLVVLSATTTTARPIYAALVLLGVVRAFTGPASRALLPELVPPEILARALAVGSSTWQIATILGPALGGLLYGAFTNAGSVYVVSAVLLVASTLLLATVDAPARPRTKKALDFEALMA